MRPLRFFCFSFFFIPIFHRRAIAQPDFKFNGCEEHQGNFTTNSTYKANLDHLLSTFTTDRQIDYGFYNFSYGHDQSRANAIGLCRGDLLPDACRSCLNNSIALLTKLCPNQKEAIGWYDECMLRYSNRSLFSFMEASPAFYAWSFYKASDPNQFTQVARNMLEELTSKAASGDSRLKYASGKTTIPNFPVIYGVVQCTPDLSAEDCSACLLGALEEIQNCCDGKAGGRIAKPSCNFRFESYLFFQEAPVSSVPHNSQPPSVPPLSNTTTPLQRKASQRVITIVVPIIVGVVWAVIITISIWIFLRKRKKRKPRGYAATSLPEDEDTDVESSRFDFDTIKTATDGFSNANKLGEGGFGTVYKVM